MQYIKNSYIIGVTGHRDLPESSLPAVSQSVADFFSETQKSHGDAVITVLSSLAKGADILCAGLALDKGFRLVVPLPIDERDYRKEIPEDAVPAFDRLLAAADEVFTVTPEEPAPAGLGEGYRYRQAGIFIVRHSDVLLAVWDGCEWDTPDGAGTWETVKLARKFGIPVHQAPVLRKGDSYDAGK